jgi:hypothetical protein
MTAMSGAAWFLEQECRALRTRLALVHPFVLHESMLPAAALAPDALIAIERFLLTGRSELRRCLDEYADWLAGPGAAESPAEQQRRFVALRWRFNDLLAQFDTFQQAITQRSETRIGIWMSGLDVAAADALRLGVLGLTAPPVVCYLDRGVGAAIRRARTRLAGGDLSPISVVRLPRERMVGGQGIGSSLFHELGHQVAALLNLVPSLRDEVAQVAGTRPEDERPAWTLWQRWLSEIAADLYSVGVLGVSSTLGLMGVVSLPRVFVMRSAEDDPHPFPWIRVHLSCVLGNLLYPHPQWSAVAALWDDLYPPTGLGADREHLFAVLRRTCPVIAGLMVGHRPAALAGRALRELLPLQERRPARLERLYDRLLTEPAQLYRARPALAFAILGQARAGGRLQPEDESRIIDDLLTHWALSSTLAAAGRCLPPARPNLLTTTKETLQWPTKT